MLDGRLFFFPSFIKNLFFCSFYLLKPGSHSSDELCVVWVALPGEVKVRCVNLCGCVCVEMVCGCMHDHEDVEEVH